MKRATEEPPCEITRLSGRAASAVASLQHTRVGTYFWERRYGLPHASNGWLRAVSVSAIPWGLCGLYRFLGMVCQFLSEQDDQLQVAQRNYARIRLRKTTTFDNAVKTVPMNKCHFTVIVIVFTDPSIHNPLFLTMINKVMSDMIWITQ